MNGFARSWLFAWTALVGFSVVGSADPFSPPQAPIPWERQDWDGAEGNPMTDKAGEGCQARAGGEKEDRPRLVLNTGGPIGTVWTMAFSPDSSRLFSAGLDKSVQVWGLHEGERSIQRTAGNKATLMQTLRWEIARGYRGVIYSMAPSPTGDKLAIGGFSARDATGDIVIYDTGTNQVDRLLRHHLQTVSALAYSPSGRRLASLCMNGELVVWSEPNWEPRVLRPVRRPAVLAFPHPVLFLDEDTLVVPESENDAGTSWRLALFDAGAPGREPRRLGQTHAGKVSALALNPFGPGWASADLAGNLFLWDRSPAPSPRLLRKQRIAASLAFAPGDRLFAATMRDANRQAVLELWDTRNASLVDQMQTATIENNYSCAVSPDGSRVATFGGDENEIFMVLLKDRAGQPIAKPLASGRVLRLRGSGRKVWKVAFDADGTYRIGLGTDRKDVASATWNDYGKLTTAFDLGNPNLLRFRNPGNENEIIPPDAARKIVRAGRDNDEDAVQRIRWRSSTDNAEGWTLTPDRTMMALQLARHGVAKGKIVLDPNQQSPAKSYCWIPDAAGRPIAVAVGVDRGGNGATGIFVYQLAEQGACPLLRYFRDHTDWITSLSASKDGKYLASASTDQTVKIWSLAGLLAEGATFRRAPGWGANFRLEAGRVVVGSVLEQGITARRGFKNGDVIVSARAIQNGQVVEITDPVAILAHLEQSPPWENQVLAYEREGKRGETPNLLVPAWEPLMTLFVDTRGEWALWTPQGYYDASVNGDALFGWQINLGARDKPDFFRADQFRRELEQPGVLRRLLSVGNVPDALRADQRPVPENLNTVAGKVGEIAEKTPIVTIVEPRDGTKLGANGSVRVVARIEYPEAPAADRFAVKAFVNGVPGTSTQVQNDGQVQNVEWNLATPNRFNRVRVVAEEGEEEDAPFAFRDVHVETNPPEVTRKLKLHVLAMAAGDYGGDLALNFPIRDATSVLEYLQEKSGEFYEPGTIRLLRDSEITRDNVQSVVAEFETNLKNANSEDLLIVFLAGHGIAFGKEYYFVPPDKSITEFNRKTIESVGISWKQLRGLASLGCRKIFMLDTCFSGNILLAEGAAENWKNSIRPLDRNEVLVLSATDVNQPALESRKLEHGVFTKFMLDGLDGKADGVALRGEGTKDGNVDLLEIVRYVETTVPEYTGQRQTPRSTPIELLELVFVPLVQTPGS